MPSCYIFYSQRIQSYYIGYTTEPVALRLSQHNDRYYENKWTSRGIPWEIFFNIECKNSQQAREIEAHIKKMKSKRYIENLVRYPELEIKLKARFPGKPDE